MSLYAWAHAVGAGEAVSLAARFPGLGLVLNGVNYNAAPELTVPPIAYVGSVAHAERVAVLAREGVRWHAAIVNDERNQSGPSGAYMSPERYAASFNEVAPILQRAGVRVSTMGLSAVGGWWRTLWWDRRFDDAYHAVLPPADVRAFNPNRVRRREVERVLRMPGPWVLSPAPFRGWFDRWRESVSVREWAAIAGHESVLAVALWCLKETQWGDGSWQAEHGLLDRHDRVTRVGRDVLAVLGA